MLFNTWFGQMRPRGNVPQGVQGEAAWYYRNKRPIGRIQLQRLIDDNYNVEYQADSRGCMDVTAPPHIRDFVGLGYPIYNGVFLEAVSLPDGPFSECPREHFLLWPDNPEYDRRVLEGLSQLKEA